MKKSGFLMVAVLVSVAVAALAWAQVEVVEQNSEEAVSVAAPVPVQAQAAQKEKKVVVPAAAPVSVPEASATPKNIPLEKAQAMLSGQEWPVYLSLANGKKPKNPADVLTFKEGKVSSQNLVAQGYPESNYTLSVTGDGVAIWETMQVNENAGLAFLRGELHGTMMKGAISLQPKKGEKMTLYFSTEVPSEAPVVVEQQPLQPQPTKKKGKK